MIFFLDRQAWNSTACINSTYEEYNSYQYYYSLTSESWGLIVQVYYRVWGMALIGTACSLYYCTTGMASSFAAYGVLQIRCVVGVVIAGKCDGTMKAVKVRLEKGSIMSTTPAFFWIVVLFLLLWKAEIL